MCYDLRSMDFVEHKGVVQKGMKDQGHQARRRGTRHRKEELMMRFIRFMHQGRP
jgi:hypothetical protein